MAQNRDKLETAAQEMVQRKGMSGLSFRTLASEVGIKSSSVHYHFPEKSDLGSALIHRYSEDFSQQLDDIVQRKSGLKDKLRLFIDIFERVGSQNKLCLCGMMAAEYELLSDVNRELLRAFFDDTEKWLVRLLETHKNEYDSRHNRKALSRTIVSSLEGALLLDRIHGGATHISAQRAVLNQIVFG